jgi:uncharacterized Zn finger protein (UPF0148 family)
MTAETTVRGRSPAAGTCPICGNPLPGIKDGRIKYCSARCRSAARRARQVPAPRRVRSRRPLPDFAKDTGWSLRKDVERLERIFADDRYPQYRQQVAAHLRGHLEYAAEVCHDLLSQLNQTGERP